MSDILYSTKIISSFNEVELPINSKVLVLCDIDDTILHFPDCDNFCKKFIKEIYPKDSIKKDSIVYDKELEKLKNTYRIIKLPNHTDYNGFVSMVKTINEMNGKLMFLTARRSITNDWTKKQFKQIGINPEEFEIHYAGTLMTKGEYIKQYINLDGWQNVIFIDDNDMYIKSVKDLHPQIICYKFDANLPSPSSP